MILKRSLHLDITYHVSQLNEAPSNAVFALPTRSASSHVVGCIYYLFLCVCVRMLEDCQDLTKDSVMNIKTGAMEQMPKSSFVFAGFPCDDVSSINNRRKALWLYEPKPIFF